jgi:four helix bundle protein
MAAQRHVFQLTLRFPHSEKWDLTNEARRSSRGVSGGIGEAWRKRRFPAHWVSKLTDSESEAAETQIWMETARDCGYITDQEFDEIFDAYEKILSQLVLMAANPDKWAIPYDKRSPSRPSASSPGRQRPRR